MPYGARTGRAQRVKQQASSKRGASRSRLAFSEDRPVHRPLIAHYIVTWVGRGLQYPPLLPPLSFLLPDVLVRREQWERYPAKISIDGCSTSRKENSTKRYLWYHRLSLCTCIAISLVLVLYLHLFIFSERDERQKPVSASPEFAISRLVDVGSIPSLATRINI